MNKWCEKEINELLKEIARIKTFSDTAEFLNIVVTPREINDMARRFKIAKMLKSDKNYTEIVNDLGVSTHTISRVAAKIGLGFCRGSKMILSDPPKKPKTIKIERSRLKYKGAPFPVIKIK